MEKKVYKAAWFCQECGRIEAPKTQRYCPFCSGKMQGSSRFEWFLCDELQRLLDLMDIPHKIIQQYALKDHRGFVWYWDLYLVVYGCDWPKGLFIEIQGPQHDRQKTYSGPGGGYTRDEDKRLEAFYNLKLHKQGVDIIYVSNEECRRKKGAVKTTACEIIGIYL